MKILFVSMNSIHFRRWSDQLRDNGHEVYWFDVKDQGYAPSMSWMTQITGWKKGFLKKRGRTFIKNKFPLFYKILVRKFDHPIEDAFAKALREIEPDIVHSFALYTSCLPILSTMNQFNLLPWIYSSWGSDLFNKENKPNYLNEVPLVLKRVDYLITDCHRDFIIAKENGFKGRFLGVYPGGGGFNIPKVSIEDKDYELIIIKGYENKLGKAFNAVEAFIEIKKVNPYLKAIVFGATNELLEMIERQNIVLDDSLIIQGTMSYEELYKLMLKAGYYIGNSLSDGMPNTLLEAICCGTFPIQSNPGNVTSEIINHEINGLLINNALDSQEIAKLLRLAVSDTAMVQKAFDINRGLAKVQLDFSLIQEKVLRCYECIKP
ncbi:glycosyltransferase family 4 protein [uncultured Dokdonia sp.]|uniref:glycosyltransferase family 4 protein n=1 Tax=Dokdonia sp. R78006 TaxID=3093866 RepID=UPI002637072F|nr:glycosyltransferase family 4 protein [uncultured Dokdonia sp.]